LPLLARLKRDMYRDSVELMRLSAELAARPGVRQFSAMMATPANLELLRAGGLKGDELADARPNDLCLAAESGDPATARAALDAAEALLESGRIGQRASERQAGMVVTRSLRGALAARPGLNLALISVPGEYAASEARRALRAGLHVMLFSDNVPLGQEVALKQEADRLGRLCMGPDCGTVLIGGLPLGFANRVRRGRIGLVGASGTGLQAVTCQIHQLGEGVSHALGSGGRDLSAEVGGRTSLAALDALASDPTTEVLAVISKPADPKVEARVLAHATELGKPVVVHFLGRSQSPDELPAGIAWAANLDETARVAVALARGQAESRGADRLAVESEAQLVAREAERGALAGLFVGGTLAAEAARILAETLGRGDMETRRRRDTETRRRGDPQTGGGRDTSAAWPRPPVAASPGEVGRVGRHVIIDLGDDALTRGRPHPIIDPSIRAAAIEQVVAEGAVILLLDVVLGYGAHSDPAGALAGPIEAARYQVERLNRRLEILASVVGTDQDPQPIDGQIARLRGSGVRVYETPTMAARVAAQAAALMPYDSPIPGR
jgi:FdrA protein